MKRVDVKRAHFHADALRRVFIHLPPEDERAGEEGVCADLVRSMYGTRDAAANWEATYTKVLVAAGFQTSSAHPGPWGRLYHSRQ